jgi:uncharacterized protein involved in exopolysaccharide biosynthesis
MKYFEEAKEFNLFNLINLLKLNLKFVIITILIFIFSIAGISYVIPQRYDAMSSLLPPKKDGGSGGLSSFIQNFTGGGGLSLGNIGQSDQSKVFGEIVKSRKVADFIIDTLKLKKRTEFADLPNYKLLKVLHSSLNVDIDKSGIIFISANFSTGLLPNADDGKNAAKLSADIANAAVKGLDKVIREGTMSSARKSKEYIEKEIVRYTHKLDSVETKLEEFQRENKVLALDEQTQAIVTQAIEVGSQLAKADLEKNLALLEFQPTSPQYEFYRKQHELLTEQYRKIQTGGLTTNESFSIPLDDVPKLIKEYTTLFRERKVVEQVILYLETQRHQEAIQEKRDVPVVDILDEALPPVERTSPNRVIMVMFAFILSIIFSAIYLIIKALINGNLYLEEKKIV